MQKIGKKVNTVFVLTDSVKVDSLNQSSTDTLSSKKVLVDTAGISKVKHRADSVKGAVNSKVNDAKAKTDSLRNNLTSKADSVKQQATDKVNAIENNASEKIEHVKAKQDSVTQAVNEKVKKLESGVMEVSEKVSIKADSLANRATDKLNTLQDKATQKLNKLSGNRLGDVSKQEGLEVQTPNLELPKTQLPTTQLPSGSQVPGVETGGASGLPDTNVNSNLKDKLPSLPETKLLDKVESVKETLADVDSKLENAGELKEKAKELKEVKNSNDVKEAVQTSPLNNVAEVSEAIVVHDQVDGYKEELKEIKEGGIRNANTERLEQEAMKVSEMKEISAQSQKFKDLNAKELALLQKYNDKKLLQQEVVRKAASIASEQVSQFVPALKLYQAEIANARKIFKKSKGVADSVKRQKPMNSLAGKSFKYRMAPGISLQTFGGTNEVLLDLGPQFGYRISDRFTVGVGGTYRIGAGKENPNVIVSKDIYGYRVFIDVAITKGLFFHGEYEATKVKYSTLSREIVLQDVQSLNVGFGKRYSIARNIKGSIIGLYRINLEGSLPGQSKFTMRMGFEYAFKKKRKKFVLPKEKSLNDSVL